jgi:hypothetical protein
MELLERDYLRCCMFSTFFLQLIIDGIREEEWLLDGMESREERSTGREGAGILIILPQLLSSSTRLVLRHDHRPTPATSALSAALFSVVLSHWVFHGFTRTGSPAQGDVRTVQGLGCHTGDTADAAGNEQEHVLVQEERVGVGAHVDVDLPLTPRQHASRVEKAMQGSGNRLYTITFCSITTARSIAMAHPPGGTFFDLPGKRSYVDVPIDESKDNAIQTTEFLEASEAINGLFDGLGVAFTPVKNDINGNVTVRLLLPDQTVVY